MNNIPFVNKNEIFVIVFIVILGILGVVIFSAKKNVESKNN